MENKKKLLVVDDDPAICEVISEGLANDFEVVTTEDIDIAFRISTQNQPDLILLDVNIKEENGIDLCARLRKNALTRKIPIVIMTGAGDREKMISSYSIGADDYIEKPIDTKMLSIRLLSRVMRSEDMSEKVSAFGNLKIYVDRNEVELNGNLHHLSQIEFTLLRVLLLNINKKVTREEILKAVWSDTMVEQRTVDVHISSLRKKLKDFNHQIESLYGSGYILRPHKHE